jgi:hypothetical protein
VGGEPAGEREQPAADGPGGADGAAGLADQFGPAQQVVGERGDHRPRAVGVELAGGEVRECLVFEVADDQLDDGVLAVLGLDDLQRLGPVGGEREVLPAGQKFALGVECPARRTMRRWSPSVVSAICAMLVAG